MSGAGPGSELSPAALTDWRLVLLSAGVGAVIAGAIYVLVLRWGEVASQTNASNELCDKTDISIF